MECPGASHGRSRGLMSLAATREPDHIAPDRSRRVNELEVAALDELTQFGDAQPVGVGEVLEEHERPARLEYAREGADTCGPVGRFADHAGQKRDVEVLVRERKCLTRLTDMKADVPKTGLLEPAPGLGQHLGLHVEQIQVPLAEPASDRHAEEAWARPEFKDVLGPRQTEALDDAFGIGEPPAYGAVQVERELVWEGWRVVAALTFLSACPEMLTAPGKATDNPGSVGAPIRLSNCGISHMHAPAREL